MTASIPVWKPWRPWTLVDGGTSPPLGRSEAARRELLRGLRRIGDFAGLHQTPGLTEGTILEFLATSPSLGEAVARAIVTHSALRRDDGALLEKDEAELCALVQEGYLSFYGKDASSPYVPLAAAGPWLVTTHGAVIHDSAGYGMLGLGHAPQRLIDAMAAPWVMANVMTPSLSQHRFASRLEKEIGRNSGSCPFDRFLCLNSGSESVTVAARISDIGAFRQTRPGARHAGKTIKVLSLEGSFHGRTYRAAQASHSTLPIYQASLASFRGNECLETFAPNDPDGLRATFARAEKDGVFFETLFLEPVMGEGKPGLAITRELYDVARRLTAESGTLLVVDSIQAGLRAHGCLSIVDYPGFDGCEPPDMETYSKALNAGQYPLSVLALTATAADLYVCGVYGNTMTTNPRALEVGCAVLDSLTDELRTNIRERGVELVSKLEALAQERPGAIVEVLGTGLMVCAELDPGQYTVTGPGGVEEQLRRRGIAMIHGGHNGLRFTPHFAITSEEIDLIVDTVRTVL